MEEDFFLKNMKGVRPFKKDTPATKTSTTNKSNVILDKKTKSKNTTEQKKVEYKFGKYKNKYVKLIVVNKKDLYGFDQFVDKLLKADAHEVKIIEDFSELDPANVSDEIIEKTEDTMTLLENYIDELDVTLDKERLKGTMRSLYTEAQDIEV